MERNYPGINGLQSDKVIWLANQIFEAFPKQLSGLKVYALGCGCIYYQKLLPDGDMDSQVGIYRDGDDGPCEVCMHLDKEWKQRVIDEEVVYNARFEVRI